MDGSAYFLDRPYSEIKEGAKSISEINSKLAHELLMDYKEGILNEAGGLLYTAKRTGPKYTKKGEIKKGSDRIQFRRNKVTDLPIQEQIRIAKDNIDNYNSLINSISLSDDELKNQLRPHNPNQLIYNDLLDILAESADSKTAIHSGPGQVGSPGRDGGEPFTRWEALKNAAQFLTEPPTDRLLHTHVSYPQQGHIFDSKNNKNIARNLSNMRAQQAAPNVKDGADARGLVHISREENLQRGLKSEIDSLLELIDERLSQNINQTEAKNLIDMARKVSGKGKRRHAAEALAIIANNI